MTALKLILKIVIAPVILLLTLAIWICVGLVYVSGLVLGLLSTMIALLGVAVLVTYSPQNGLILLVIAFLISPFGLPKLAFWLLGKVQALKYAIQDLVYGLKYTLSHWRRGCSAYDKTSGEARRRSYGSRLSSLKSGEAKKVSIPIPSPWHISWMIRSFTES